MTTEERPDRLERQNRNLPRALVAVVVLLAETSALLVPPRLTPGG